MNRTLLSALVAATFVTTSFGSFADDLVQVYQTALANDPQVLKAEANYRSSQHGVDKAFAKLLPQVDFSSSWNYSKSDNSVAESKSGSMTNSFGLTQSLFNFALWKQLDIAEQQGIQNKVNLDLAKQTLINRVSTAYFGVLSAIDDLEFARAEKRAIERQLEQTKQRYQVGLTAMTDVHETQAQFDNAIANEIRAENGVETAKENLREITGKYHSELAPLNTSKFTPPKPDKDAQQFIEQAEQQSLELQVAKLSVDVARYQTEIAESGHYPTLSASASLTQSRGNSDKKAAGTDWAHETGPTTDTAKIGLTLSVPIFEGFGTQANIEQSREQFIVASEDLELRHRAVSKNIRNSYNNVMALIASIRALEQSVVSAESALKATETGFEVGTRNIVEVLQSTRNLFDAKRRLAKARYDYINAILSLKQSVGNLSEQDVQTINQSLGM